LDSIIKTQKPVPDFAGNGFWAPLYYPWGEDNQKRFIFVSFISP